MTLRKAVIPAAGYGTRLFPATKAIKKEFFPIIDRDGRTKPVILAIVEEALSAGIEEIAIVVQACDRPLFAHFFQAPLDPVWLAKLSPENQQYCEELNQIGDRISFVVQPEQEGYGHAVYCAKDWVGDEPFLLMLGDHVYRSATDQSCAAQLVEVYQQHQTNALSLTTIPVEIVHKAGVVFGDWLTTGELLKIQRLYEKPTVDFARENLRIDHLAQDEFLAVFGLYIIEPGIFEVLEADIKSDHRFKGEFQLTTSLDRFCQTQGGVGLMVQGQYFDTGMPLFYRQALLEFSAFEFCSNQTR